MAEIPEETPSPTRQRNRTWLVLLMLPVVIAAAGLLSWRVANQRRGDQEPPAFLPRVESPSTLNREVPIETPVSLEAGDSRLKQLGAGWSKDPGYARLLEQLSLRHLVAAVQLVAAGDSPKPALPFLSVPGAFAVREEGKATQERRFMTKASFARYDVLGKLIGSVDAGAAGDAYAQLRPYCDAAFKEIGRPGKRFEDQLTAAVRRIVGVQFPEGEVELVPKGAVFAYADPTLESLSAAEKQVLRMGPENGRVLQRQLKAFAERAKLNLSPDVR